MNDLLLKIKNILFIIFVIFITYFFICCFFNIDFFALPDYFYYTFNKNKEIISLDKDSITVKYSNDKDYDIVDCAYDYSDLDIPDKTDCYIDKKIDYLAIQGTLYNSFNQINAILNENKAIKIENGSSSSEFFNQEIYRSKKFYIKLNTKKYKLKQGTNKITVNGNNKVDTIYIYYKY